MKGITTERMALECLRWALIQYNKGTNDFTEEVEVEYWKGYIDGTKTALEGVEEIEGITLSIGTIEILYDFYETTDQLNGSWDIEGDHEDFNRIIRSIDKALGDKE